MGPLGCFPTEGSLLQGALGSHLPCRQHPLPSSQGAHFRGGFYPCHPFPKGVFTPLASTSCMQGAEGASGEAKPLRNKAPRVL